MLSIYAQHGTEKFVEFAKTQLVRLQALREDLRLDIMRRHFVPAHGVRVDIEASIYGDKIRIFGNLIVWDFLVTQIVAGVPPSLFMYKYPSTKPATLVESEIALTGTPTPALRASYQAPFYQYRLPVLGQRKVDKKDKELALSAVEGLNLYGLTTANYFASVGKKVHGAAVFKTPNTAGGILTDGLTELDITTMTPFSGGTDTQGGGSIASGFSDGIATSISGNSVQVTGEDKVYFCRCFKGTAGTEIMGLTEQGVVHDNSGGLNPIYSTPRPSMHDLFWVTRVFSAPFDVTTLTGWQCRTARAGLISTLPVFFPGFESTAVMDIRATKDSFFVVLATRVTNVADASGNFDMNITIYKFKGTVDPKTSVMTYVTTTTTKVVSSDLASFSVALQVSDTEGYALISRSHTVPSVGRLQANEVLGTDGTTNYQIDDSAAAPVGAVASMSFKTRVCFLRVTPFDTFNFVFSDQTTANVVPTPGVAVPASISVAGSKTSLYILSTTLNKMFGSDGTVINLAVTAPFTLVKQAMAGIKTKGLLVQLTSRPPVSPEVNTVYSLIGYGSDGKNITYDATKLPGAGVATNLILPTRSRIMRMQEVAAWG